MCCAVYNPKGKPSSHDPIVTPMKCSVKFEKDMEASDQYFKNGDYENCINTLVKALEYLPLVTSRQESLIIEKEVLSRLISCYIAYYGYGSKQVADAITQASILSKELQDNSYIFSLLWTNWSNVIVNGNILQAQRFATEIMDLAEQNPEDTVIFVEAFHCLGVTEFNAGQFEQSAKFLATGLQNFNDKNRNFHIQNYGNDPEVLLLSWLSWSNLLSGKIQQSLSYREKLIAALTTCVHDSSYAFGYTFNAMNYVFQDQPEECINALNSLDKTKAEKLPFWSSWVHIIQKWAEYHTNGNFSSIEQDIQDFVNLQGNIWAPFFSALHADINAKENPDVSAEMFESLIGNIKLRQPSFHSLPVLYFYCKNHRDIDEEKYEEARKLANLIIDKQGAFYWEDKFQ